MIGKQHIINSTIRTKIKKFVKNKEELEQDVTDIVKKNQGV